MRIVFVSLLLTVLMADVNAQPCTNLGQTPSTAFPVCGTKKFEQAQVPICSTTSLFVPGCTGSSNANYANKNPYFYRFTCYTAGTLGFIVTPLAANEDYDWMLYDITNRLPDDIFTVNSTIVTGNWAGTFGATGANASGVNFIQCASDPSQNLNSFSAMPQLIVGHTYLLMVSHFSDTQSGYTLEFTGGTASITDPLVPSLKDAKPKCDSKELVIKLNKKIRCNTIASNGSDFSLSPSIANVVSVTGINCNNSFDTDSLLVTFDNTIPAGNYALVAKNGTDGNTLLDNCDNAVPVGQQVPFTVLALQPTPIDSLVPVKCAPNKLTLVFKKNIKCSSIAPDGSDFFITGTFPVAISSANGVCNADGNTSIIEINLSQPIQQAGNFTITLKNGLDGNPIIDECGIPTPVGQGQSFSTKDTVNADFTFNVTLGCKEDEVEYFHPGGNGIDNWRWSFDNSRPSSQQNPVIIYTSTGNKTTQLIVSNGFCSDTTRQTFVLPEKLKAAITGPTIICPEDTAVFRDASINATGWLWDFANGNNSTQQNPPAQQYPKNNVQTNYTIRLIANDGTCADTAYHVITTVKNCYIDVPTAFTPNNDGLNDYLYPLNAYKADNLEFKVYNRFGQLVFETKDWMVRWDGTLNGNLQPAGTYAWYLKYTHKDTGKKIFIKGTTVLIR